MILFCLFRVQSDLFFRVIHNTDSSPFRRASGKEASTRHTQNVRDIPNLSFNQTTFIFLYEGKENSCGLSSFGIFDKDGAADRRIRHFNQSCSTKLCPYISSVPKSTSAAIMATLPTINSTSIMTLACFIFDTSECLGRSSREGLVTKTSRGKAAMLPSSS